MPRSIRASSQLHAEEKEVTVPVLHTTVSKHISRKLFAFIWSLHEAKKKKKKKKRKPWKNFSWGCGFYEIWISSEMLQAGTEQSSVP